MTPATANHALKLAFALSIASIAAGCGGDPGGPGAAGETVGATEQAFSGYWIWGRGLYSNTTPPSYLGTDSDKTCFLAGVTGNLYSASGFPEPQGASYTSSNADVRNYNGGYWLDTTDGTGSEPVYASTVCLPTTANRTPVVGWASGYPAAVLAPVTPNRQCGLTGIANSDDGQINLKFSGNNDTVQVWNDGTNWYIGGTGNAQGAARCVDVGGVWGNWTWWPRSMSTLQLMQHTDHGTTPLGVQCFLTGIGGRFRYNDWNSGVQIKYDPGSQWWSMQVSSSKLGQVVCVQ